MSLEECHETNVKLAEKLDSDNDGGEGGGGQRSLAYQIVLVRITRFCKMRTFKELSSSLISYNRRVADRENNVRFHATDRYEMCGRDASLWILPLSIDISL